MGITILTGLIFGIIFVAADSLYLNVKTGADCEMDNTTLRCNNTVPAYIPDGVTDVIVANYFGGDISSDMFVSKSWEVVRVFSLTSTDRTSVLPRAFRNLRNLGHLALHGPWMLIGSDSFLELGVLDSLDLSECLRIRMVDFLGALNGSERVKQVSTLNISQLSVFRESNKLDSVFSNILGPKQISVLNISFTTISELNLTSIKDSMCDKLNYIIMNDCHLPNFDAFTDTCPSLRRIDMERAVVAQVVPGFFPPNIFYPFDLRKVNTFNLFTNIAMIDINWLLQSGLPPVYNITIESLTNVTVKIKRFSMSNNGIKYLDLNLINVTSTIEYLDLSSNGLSYLQPMLLSKSNIKTLDLSRNNMYKMAEKNLTEFATFFWYLKFLERINLAANHLSILPKQAFRFNKYLVSVDLSNNDFQQIDCWFVNNPVFVNLNLRENKISTLSAISMGILEEQSRVQKMFQVDLRNNQLLCNKCDSKAFVRWLVENEQFVVTDDMCLGEKNKREVINKAAISQIEDICKRAFRIAIITSSCTVSLVTLTVIVCTVTWHVKRKNKQKKVEHILGQFREGRHEFRFPVFLAFSGNDENFVEHFILEPLRENLNRMTGANRELICTGDRHFKLGHSIAEQMEECCRQSGVIVLVVSKSFCASNHCGYETQIAFTMQKPIILLFKENVPEADMSPLLRVIFQQFTRIMFKREGQGLKMSTTWENVCNSIFELIIKHPRTDQIEISLQID